MGIVYNCCLQVIIPNSRNSSNLHGHVMALISSQYHYLNSILFLNFLYNATSHEHWHSYGVARCCWQPQCNPAGTP